MTPESDFLSIFDEVEERTVDGNGDTFDVWVIKRSFDLLLPFCRMTLIILLLMVGVVDPLMYLNGHWANNPYYIHLAVWHGAMLVYFSLLLLAIRRCQTHPARKAMLQFFFIGTASGFVAFGVISWFLNSDMSIVAMILIGMSAVFSFPGHLRRVVLVSSAVLLSGLIAWLDPQTDFFTSGVVVNLVAVVAVAFVLDGYMMRNTRGLFQEKCRVESERERADAVLYNALPVSIANELKESHTVKAERYEHLTVLFADIVGFTHYSSGVSPDKLVEVLNQIFSSFDRLVDHYDAEKIKTIGDAYMVVGKDNPVAMADLAHALLAALAEYNASHKVNFELRVGMHIGPAVAGVIGLKRFLYDVWGDAVNTASRMESTGLPGRIHVSLAMARALGNAYTFESRGEIEIKGKGLMPTWFLLTRNTNAKSGL